MRVITPTTTKSGTPILKKSDFRMIAGAAYPKVGYFFKLDGFITPENVEFELDGTPIRGQLVAKVGRSEIVVYFDKDQHTPYYKIQF